MESATYGRHTLRTTFPGHEGTHASAERASRRLATALALVAALVPGAAVAQNGPPPPPIVVIGVGPSGSPLPGTIGSYRWTLEEDATRASIPGVPANLSNLSYGFHTSYMPVVAAGKVTDGAQVIGHVAGDPDPERVYQAFPALDPGKRYFLSILPDAGFQMGAAPIAAGQTATVYVNQYPVPAAQISIHVFQDNNPLNGAPDLPEEQGLEGFFVELVEAGGTFGMSGGQVTQDAYGNPLGTVYPAGGGDPIIGTGIVTTDANGTALIRNLYPGKYTIKVRPPVGQGWVQTSTIEGTKGIDAWVKNGEPPFFQEFGPPGHHVFIGFTKSGKLLPSVLNGDKQIKGKVVNIHMSRPPDYAFYSGAPVPKCWVALNEPNGGRTLWAGACDAGSNFVIPNVPAGTWELVVFDEPLDVIIASTTITVDASDGVVDLIEVPVFSWFARWEGSVFYDDEENGFPLLSNGAPKPTMPEVPVDIRFRDGSIYQASSTSRIDGTFEFPELFPFFSWLVAEVDYSRFMATGATVVVDAGGPIPTPPYGPPSSLLTVPHFNRLNPQAQFEQGPTGLVDLTRPAINPNTGNNLSRTETGTVLLEGIQAFIGQTIHVDFGKKAYAGGQNGGIAGIVHYAITRAEVDPRYAAAEPWEPGVPRVQVQMYLDCDKDGKPDRPDHAKPGTCIDTVDDPGLSSHGYVFAPADVDNYPFCWRDPGSCGLDAPQKGPEDYERSGNGADFSYGDVFTWGHDPESLDVNGNPLPFVGLAGTDSWDDSIPSGCQPDPQGRLYQIPYGSDAGTTLDCYDGMRSWNQARPAVFDGGYAFGRVAFQDELPIADYVVEAIAPPGYRHQGSGDMNVVFGDEVSTSALPLRCVGPELEVPRYLSLFPAAQEPNPAFVEGAALKWNRCDMKAVPLRDGQNPAPDFHLFTEAPVAGHAVGFILDDLSNEFDPNAPTFGEKHAPPWLPVSIHDWTGREIQRVYSDQWGTYNFLVPSTFTINPPFPSGVSPSMLTACMNSPGPIRDTRQGSPTLGQMIIDPHFNRQYSQFCYTFQYLPGKTTYLDTPVVPVAAFAGPGQYPVDCEPEATSPVIYSVDGRSSSGNRYGDNGGPFVVSEGNGPNSPRPRLVIVSMGTVQVPNPAYDPAGPDTRPTIGRDYGFGGTPGSVTLTPPNGNPVTLGIVSWSDGTIVANVPGNVPLGPSQLLVQRGTRTSAVGVTVTKLAASANPTFPRQVRPGQSIQAAIDAAANGELIVIWPGTYNEYVIMDKQVQLQGWGAPSTILNAAKIDASKLKAWRRLLAQKIDARQDASCPVVDPDTGACPVTSGPARTFDLLPGQALGANVSDNEPVLFGAEEGPGVLVVGGNPTGPSANARVFTQANRARIDGLTVTGADYGGGILASGYARFLQVSNNRILSNYGTYGGGVRIGHTDLLDEAGAPAYGGYTDSVNPGATIQFNWIAQNGSTEAGVGGGITLGNGSSGYAVRSNYVCGNFAMGGGGGIGHLGLSTGGVIANNTILFNQSFNQSVNVAGGGIFVGGEPALAPAGQTLSPGSGSVSITANVIKGNHAGAGEGGGIALAQVNGLDAAGSNSSSWYRVSLVNNIIVNNVAGYVAGGVSLQDALTTWIVNNTIANNDSTATNQQSFTANASESNPQPAGLVSHGTTPALQAAITDAGVIKAYSSPAANRFLNNVIWHNRSFYWKIDESRLDSNGNPIFGLFDPFAGTPAGTTPVYLDLAVIDVPNQGTFAGGFVGNGVPKLTPRFTILSQTTAGQATNVSTADGYGPNSAQNRALANAGFVLPYHNGNRQQTVIVPGVTTTIGTAAAVDEGGNFIDVHFGPLTPVGDYELLGTSPAVNTGTFANGVTPSTDYEGDARPNNGVDVGADEYVAP